MPAQRTPPRRGPRIISPAREPASVPPPLAGAWAPADTRLEQARLLPLPSGRYRMITGVRQYGDTLYLGSLVEPAVAVVML